MPLLCHTTGWHPLDFQEFRHCHIEDSSGSPNLRVPYDGQMMPAKEHPKQPQQTTHSNNVLSATPVSATEQDDRQWRDAFWPNWLWRSSGQDRTV